MAPSSIGDPAPRASRRRWLRRRAFEVLLAVLLAPIGVELVARRLHGRRELVRVGDDQIGVVLDRWTGKARVTSVPGYLLRAPWLQEITLLPRSPRTLAVGTPGATEPGAAQRLLVRAEDGSTFRLGHVAVQYAVPPEAATTKLEDLGPEEDPPRGLLAAHVRAIVRDEFGRVSPEELARGEKVGDVLAAATARLQAAMAPHGIAVLSITAGKPEFDEAYEDTIGRAKTFRQQADELAESTERLAREREASEVSIAKKKEVELSRLEGELVRDRGAAVRDDRIARQEADDFFRGQARSGESARIEKQAQAELVKARHTAAARDVLRDGADLELAGELPVRKALVEKLAGIRIDLVPPVRDEAPGRETGAKRAPQSKP